MIKPDGRDGLPFRPLVVHGVRRAETGNLIKEVPALDSSNYPPQRQPERQYQTIELDEERMVHVDLPDKYPSKLLEKIIADLVEVDSNYNVSPPGSWNR